ncbi:MAG: SMP-30/gluconolactonase/LRE family protein [Lentisphaeraceae bacterium]|nr:SMP-30/gluconolactonase/LRE family protein [Lentisphaeraceae bacterium]
MNLETYTEHIAKLGEGPLYHEGNFYWVDLISGTFMSKGPDGLEKTLYENAENPVTSIVPGKDGFLRLTLANGFARYVDGEVVPEQSFQLSDPLIRFNDGKCDSLGNYWAGTMDNSEITPKGALYSLRPDKTVVQVLAGVTVSNGMCWSADQETLYYIDSPTKRVRAYDLDPISLTVSNRRSIFKIEEKDVFPDGMCIDLEGNLWVALWGGSAVLCIDPETGAQLDKIDIPCLKVTSCCFGGPSFDQLFITTASKDMTDKDWERYPDSGKVFKATPGVIGLPADTYG